jgi:hypothetical protein
VTSTDSAGCISAHPFTSRLLEYVLLIEKERTRICIRNDHLKPSLLRPVLNIGALVAVLLVNWLANALPLNGKDTGQISDQYPILTVPARYAFAIWSLIYVGLTGFAIYQSLSSQRTKSANSANHSAVPAQLPGQYRLAVHLAL